MPSSNSTVCTPEKGGRDPEPIVEMEHPSLASPNTLVMLLLAQQLRKGGAVSFEGGLLHMKLKIGNPGSQQFNKQVVLSVRHLSRMTAAACWAVLTGRTLRPSANGKHEGILKSVAEQYGFISIGGTSDRAKEINGQAKEIMDSALCGRLTLATETVPPPLIAQRLRRKKMPRLQTRRSATSTTTSSD